MEFESLPTIEEKSYVLLCQQCLEIDEYTIPTYELNSFGEVQYKCPKDHKIEKSEILLLSLDNDIKKRLNQCTKAEHLSMGLDGDHIFYAWCEQCKRNECELDISSDVGHDYILYEYVKPDDNMKIVLKDKLDKLKALIDKYNKCSPNSIEFIHYLTKTYNRNFMNYNLYFNEKILNYQTCINVLFNMSDDFKDNLFDVYEDNLTKFEYVYLYKDLLNDEQTNKLSTRILFRKFMEKEIIIPLIREIKDKSRKNEIYFGLFTQFLDGKALFIYDSNKNKINKIDITPEENFGIIKYQNNIIIIYDSSTFNIIYFSEDYKTHQIFKLNIHFQNQNIYSDGLYLKINGYYFELLIKLLRTSSYKFIYLYNGKAYSIDMGKYLDKKINLTDGDEILNPLLKDSNCVLNGNSIYYKYNNLTLEGIILISYSSVTNKSEIIMFDENLDTILEIEFKYNFSETHSNGVFHIDYNCINNMISVFINSEIYIINSSTKEVTTIYNITNYIIKPKNIPSDIIDFHKQANVVSFYYYNEETKEIEQDILLMNNHTKDIYHFYWDGKSILLKKKYDAVQDNLRIIPIVSPYILHSLNGEGIHGKNNRQKNFIEGIIRLDSNKLILVW